MHKNSAQLLDNGIILVHKSGPQTEHALLKLFGQIHDITADLRAAGKRVLILSDATDEGPMDPKGQEIAARIGTNLDFDKSASFGNAPYIFEMRQQMIADNKLGDKVGEFHTEAEAIAWLQQP